MRNKKQYGIITFINRHEITIKWEHGIFTIEGMDNIEDENLFQVFKEALELSRKARHLDIFDGNGNGVDKMGLPARQPHDLGVGIDIKDF
jgi:hypothetical protein